MKKKAPLFTDDEMQAIRSGAYSVWNDCGSDIMQMVAEEGKSSVSRAVVLEIVLDANRLAEKLKAKHPALAKRLNQYERADYDAIEKDLKKTTFTYARYA